MKNKIILAIIAIILWLIVIGFVSLTQANTRAERIEYANNVVMYDMRIADMHMQDADTRMVEMLAHERAWRCYQLTDSDSPYLCRLYAKKLNTLVPN
jgi:hypothetical protein